MTCGAPGRMSVLAMTITAPTLLYNCTSPSERSCLWGEQPSAGNHHLLRMRKEVQACFKEAGINPGLE